MDHTNPFKPMPSIPAYRVPCYSPGFAHSYALAGRQHGVRDDGRLPCGRRSTFPPGVARAARGDAVILDQAHLHIFCHWNQAFVARQRPPQPALCSRPSCSPGHRSSVLSLLSLQMLHAAVAAAARWRPALSSIFRPSTFERCMQRFWAKKIGACGGRRAIVAAAAWRCWRHRCGFMCSCNRCNVYVTVAVTRVERVRWGQNFFIAYSCRSRRADFGCQIRFESFDHL